MPTTSLDPVTGPPSPALGIRVLRRPGSSGMRGSRGGRGSLFTGLATTFRAYYRGRRVLDAAPQPGATRLASLTPSRWAPRRRSDVAAADGSSRGCAGRGVVSDPPGWPARRAGDRTWTSLSQARGRQSQGWPGGHLRLRGDRERIGIGRRWALCRRSRAAAQERPIPPQPQPHRRRPLAGGRSQTAAPLAIVSWVTGPRRGRGPRAAPERLRPGRVLLGWRICSVRVRRRGEAASTQPRPAAPAKMRWRSRPS
jgi:hypothetical protein